MRNTTRTARAERFFDGLNLIALGMVSLCFLIPFLVVFGTSFISEAEFARRSFIVWPENPVMDSYASIFARSAVLSRAYAVTVFRITVGVLFNLFFTATYAFAISRPRLPGKTFFTLFLFMTTILSGGLIPGFLVVKYTGVYGTIWSLVIPGLINAWWLLIMRNFFATIPIDLEEAAIIDGATPFQTLAKVFLPLSLPSIATIGLFYAVQHWNSWFDALIFLPDESMHPIQMILRKVIVNASIGSADIMSQSAGYTPPAESLKSAVIIVTTLPILVVYPFLQRYFVKGVLVGGVKG